MASEKNRRYEDDNFDKIDIRYAGQKSRNNKLLIGLLVGGAALVLGTCVCGGGIIAVIAFSNRATQPDRFVGAWKGRFALHGQQRDFIYTFNKTGTLQEQAFDLQGRQLSVSGGTWRFRDGKIEIDWNSGSVEVAETTFVDDNTMNYLIVSHTEWAQIGTSTTFRRQ